jgi:flagellin-like protein
MQLKKKGVSPVVATILLITLVVILAVILWIWIRSFIGEKVTKDVGSGDEAIENFCQRLQFNADVYIESSSEKLLVNIENTGNIPLYGVEIKKKSFASLKSIGIAVPSSESIPSGETASGVIVMNDGTEVIASVVKLDKGNSVLVLPVLMGMAKDSKKVYTCDKQYGIDKEVG